jgi:membrane protein YqaA with SNARE-associated domain
MLAAKYDPILCLFVASTGNTLGGWLNYAIGYLGNPKWLMKVGATTEKIEKWQIKVNKYGAWLALLSWLPFVGDVIGIALGFFRANIFVSFLFIGIGKFVRYGVIVLFALYY